MNKNLFLLYIIFMFNSNVIIFYDNQDDNELECFIYAEEIDDEIMTYCHTLE